MKRPARAKERTLRALERFSPAMLSALGSLPAAGLVLAAGALLASAGLGSIFPALRWPPLALLGSLAYDGMMAIVQNLSVVFCVGIAAFLARRFVDFVQAVFASWGEIAAVFCDNAEQVLIASLRSALLDTKFSWLAGRVYNAKKIAINDRIRLTSILMGSGRFWYMPGAASLADALATALWSGQHPGEDTRLDDGTTDIDTLDAFEYTIERERARLLKL